MAKKKLIFDWEYCEDGSHSHTAKIAGEWYAVNNDLKGKYYLTLPGYMYPSDDCVFDSWQKAEKYIIKSLASRKKELLAIKKSINLVLKEMGKK